MQTRHISRILAAALLLLPAAACERLDTDGRTGRIAPGESLPSFSVTLSDGRTVTDGSLASEDALLVFFHTLCPDCVKELALLQPFYEKYGGEVNVILVSRAQDASEIEAYWMEHGYTMPYSPQKDRRVYELFSTSGIPFAVLSVKGTVEAVWDDTDMFSEEEYLKHRNR